MNGACKQFPPWRALPDEIQRSLLPPSKRRRARRRVLPLLDYAEQRLAKAVVSAAGRAVAEKLYGDPPAGMDHDDLTQAVAIGTLIRARRWRHGGSKTIEEYCYVAAGQALRDILRRRPRDPLNGAAPVVESGDGDGCDPREALVEIRDLAETLRRRGWSYAAIAERIAESYGGPWTWRLARRLCADAPRGQLRIRRENHA